MAANGQDRTNVGSRCTKERAIELFDYHTSTLYTLAFQAVCITQIMPQPRSLKEIVPLAREAYLGVYSGYRASSILHVHCDVRDSLRPPQDVTRVSFTSYGYKADRLPSTPYRSYERNGRVGIEKIDAL